MEPYASVNFIFVETIKQIWDAVKEVYSQEKNTSRIHQLYEHIFGAEQNEKPLSEHYAFQKEMWEEWNVYKPLFADIEVQRRKREEFLIAKFLSRLDFEYAKVKHSILASEKLPSLSNVHAHLQCIDLQYFSSGNNIKNTSALATTGQGRGGLLFKAEAEV